MVSNICGWCIQTFVVYHVVFKAGLFEYKYIPKDRNFEVCCEKCGRLIRVSYDRLPKRVTRDGFNLNNLLAHFERIDEMEK